MKNLPRVEVLFQNLMKLLLLLSENALLFRILLVSIPRPRSTYLIFNPAIS